MLLQSAVAYTMILILPRIQYRVPMQLFNTKMVPFTLSISAVKIKPFSKRILKDDCLDLPEKSYVKHYVELTKEQKKVYEQMKKEAIAFLDGKMQSSATVMTQLMRLHQVAI